MRRAVLVGCGIVLLCLAVASVPFAVADSEYSVTTDRSIEVPDRTVEQGGDTFTITEISRADPSDSISVTADAPDDTDITLYLYNNDRAIVDAREGTGTTTFDFTLENDSGVGYEAGTYAFVLQQDGSREAVHPLVVRGYSVSVESPSAVTTGEEISVSTDVEKLRGDDLENVEVVLANEETTLRETASEEGDGTYTTTIETDGLSAGTYDLYATVRGTEQALGQSEILGLSDPQEVEIEAEDSTETSESASGGAGGGGTSEEAEAETTASSDETTDETTATDPQDQQSAAVAESITKEIVDEESDTAGVSVNTDTETLTEITFSDGAVQATGDLTVERYSTPSATFTQQFDETDVLTSVNIEVPPAATSSSATLRFTVGSAALGDRQAEHLGVVRAVDGGLQVIPSEVEQTDSGVTVTAETPGFSEFAVVYIEPPAESTATDTTTTAATPGGSESTSGAGDDGAITPSTQTGTGSEETTTGSGPAPFVGALVFVLLAVLLGARRRRP
jgi:MYXO-CTERM domain-containing protein